MLSRFLKSALFLLKSWDWKLFASILLYMSVPPLYQSYSLFLIGNTPPTDNNLGVLSQWQFVQVAMEVIQETFVLPMFFFIGSRWKDDVPVLLRRVAIGLNYLLVVLVPVTILGIAGMVLWVDFMDVHREIRDASIQFLRLKLLAISLVILNTALVVMAQSLRKSHLIIVVLLLRLSFSVIFDSWLFGGYVFSLNLGVNGVALSNVLTESLLLLVVSIYFARNFGRPIKQYFRFSFFPEFQVLRRISQWITLESLIRNGVYFLMILKWINELGPKQIGGYYLAMHLFWSFALVPILALADTMKALIANSSSKAGEITQVLKTGVVLGFIVVMSWCTATPFIGQILDFFSDDPVLVDFAAQTASALFLPYILLAFNLLLDALFIGLGKTKFLALQSIFTNAFVYGSAFLMYKIELWAPTFSNILILFSIGILVDTVFTIAYAREALRMVRAKG